MMTNANAWYTRHLYRFRLASFSNRLTTFSANMVTYDVASKIISRSHLQLGSRTPSSWVQTHNAPLRGSDIFGQRWTLLCCITLQRQLQHLQPQGAVKQGHTYMYLLAHHNNARYALKCPIYAVGTMKHFDHDSARTCYPNQWKMKKRTKKIKQLINHQSLNQPAACVGKQTNPFDFRKNKK